MPYLQIQTNVEIAQENQATLLTHASQTVAQALGKSENYVMVALEENVPMLFGGSNDPCAFLLLQSLGLQHQQTAELSEKLCDFIAKQLNIAKDRIYIEFASPERIMWGWNGKTF